MNPTEKRLVHLLHHRDHVKVMIIGLGSVGTYLLDYLCSSGDPALEVVVAGRNMEKMESDVNIVRVASMIRGQNRTKVAIDNSCDLERVEAVAACIAKHQPDIIINSSRVRSGLKYGSISWRAFRAYGIWAPLAVKYTKTIMDAAELAGSQAIVINTSYSDPMVEGRGLPVSGLRQRKPQPFDPQDSICGGRHLGVRRSLEPGRDIGHRPLPRCRHQQGRPRGKRRTAAGHPTPGQTACI